MILFDAHGRPARRVLDEHRAPDMLRVEVRAWAVLEVLTGLAFVQPRSPARVLAYARHVGVAATARKIAARLSAPAQDRRVSALGAGVVLEAPDRHAALRGQAVVFFHPHALDNPERVVLPASLVAPATPAHAARLPSQFVACSGASIFAHSPAQECMTLLRGLSEQHVAVCNFDQVAGLHDALRALADLLLPDRAPQRSSPQRPSPVLERTARPARSPEDARVEATLFGYGHHARTALIPNLTRRFALTCVHEVDPSRLPERPAPWAWDTAPAPRTSDRAALTVSAGWHHTHAAIAASALNRGAWALIEKPAVTSYADLALLLDALSAQPASRLFVAYHKRYAVEGAHLRDDLLLGQPGPPMRYHATVHVVRLPPRHWYRWPVSGSRLLSNGCHYIDHFLWLNDWSPVTAHDVLPSPLNTAHIQITLDNGAWMTLTISDSGSDRLGTRELIEISRGERTARIVDARYTAEDSSRVLRSVALDRMAPYARMIDAVADRIAAGLPGDSPESVRMTHQLALDLDAALLARQVPR